MADNLGDYLRELRGKRSLREVAAASHGAISHTGISQAERGVNGLGKPSKPMPETLKILADLYGVDATKLLQMADYLPSDYQLPDQPEFETTDVTVKVYGEIHAGEAAWADENIIGRVPITREMRLKYGAENLFALRIKGDSMNNVLLGGYVAIFAKDCPITNGDIVAVLIDHEDATVKRYHMTSAGVLFEPDSTNPVHQPYFFSKDDVQDFEVLGRYIYATTLLI